MNESDNGGEEEVHPATGLRDRDFFRASCLNGFDLSSRKFSSWDVSVVDLGSEYLVVALHGDLIPPFISEWESWDVWENKTDLGKMWDN